MVVVPSAATVTLARGFLTPGGRRARNRAAGTGRPGIPRMRASTLVVPAGMIPRTVVLPAIDTVDDVVDDPVAAHRRYDVDPSLGRLHRQCFAFHRIGGPNRFHFVDPTQDAHNPPMESTGERRRSRIGDEDQSLHPPRLPSP